MLRVIFTLILLSNSWSDAEDVLRAERSWIGEPLSAQFAKFQSLTVFPSPSDKTIVAAYCEKEKAWWGDMRVFKHARDKVSWAAVFPKEYLEQRGHYVVSCRWAHLDDEFKNPVLELIESTHMGNGSLWLLELQGQDLRILLHTPVRGRYWGTEPVFRIPLQGEARIAGEHLKVEYRKAPGDEHVSVFLTGSLLITDMTGKEWPSRPYYQQCSWDPKVALFKAQPPAASAPEQAGSPEPGKTPNN